MRSALLIFCALLFGSTQFFAQGSDTGTRKKQFNLTASGVALSGYDATTYFTGKPKKGNTGFTYTYNGVSYLFASAANMELFKKSPSKFEPAYGGWCAYAMGASGEKVEVDPETYKLVDGKLYLFYNAFFNNTLPKWNKDEAGLKAKADRNWATLFK